MKQTLSRSGKLSIDLLNADMDSKQERDKFTYFYLALDYDVRKCIENAFYKALSQRLVERKQSVIIQKNGSVNYIRVHVNDIMDNLTIIKHLIEPHEDDYDT